MKIWRADAETMALSDFNPLIRHLLHQIVPSADPEGNREVLSRLYSSPTAGREPEFDEEWQELVGMDLRDHFDAATTVVREDLARLSSEDDNPHEVLRVPVNHLESWVNALNQARLAIATRHRFTEREMESMPPETHPHALPLFQMHFYGMLQEQFIREIGG